MCATQYVLRTGALVLLGVMAIALVAAEQDAVRAPVDESQEVKAVPEKFVIQIGTTTVYGVAGEGEEYVLIAITDVRLADGTFIPKDDPVFIGDVVVEGTIGNAGETEIVLVLAYPALDDDGMLILPPSTEATAGCAKLCSCAATSDLCYCQPYYDTDRQMDCCNCYRRRNGVGSCNCVAADKE